MKKMKKIFSTLLVISFLAVMMMPMLTLAQADKCTLKHEIKTATSFTACTKGTTVDETITNEWGMCCILDALYTATDWIFVVLIILVGLLIIYGGITIATAGGSPEKATQGRGVILYALIGLAIALLSKALPAVVKALLGV